MPQRVLLALAIVAGLVTAWPTPFAQAFSGQLQGIYGQVDNEELEGGGASLAVGSRFGLQLDGAYAEREENQLKGVGLHLLYRQPDHFLFGLLAAHGEDQNVDLNRLGIEGDLYLKTLTLAATAGQQQGDIDDNLFATADLHWYPTPELVLTLGGAFADKNDGRLHLGAEYQIFPGLAAFIDAAAGENHYDHLLGGIRLYIGRSKPLINRHRENDRPNPVIDNLLQGLASIESRR
ncbi:MAG: hypothetical protein RBT64_11035 [Trichloromonas sp.]|jgi:hypothetical protein|nr:hypothetical protein [Trichloromonas sp.]